MFPCGVSQDCESEKLQRLCRGSQSLTDLFNINNTCRKHLSSLQLTVCVWFYTLNIYTHIPPPSHTFLTTSFHHAHDHKTHSNSPLWRTVCVCVCLWQRRCTAVRCIIDWPIPQCMWYRLALLIFYLSHTHKYTLGSLQSRTVRFKFTGNFLCVG